MSRGYSLFVSHSWAYGDAYEKLCNLLRDAPRFDFRNYSVSKNDPIHNAPNASRLYAEIRKQMGYAQCVLVLAGVYSTYSTWIQKEIQIAEQEFAAPKPIIAIQPWGAEKTSAFVKQHADRIVNWNTNSIVAAIRDLCR